MIDAFPELKALFKLQSFDHSALEECISTIDKVYVQKDKNKMAHALLKLELLKYSMHEVKNEEVSKTKKNRVQKKSLIKYKNEKNTAYWKNFIGKSLSEIAKQLDVRPEFIMRLLSQKGIQISLKQIFQLNELENISDYIENRIQVLKRQRENKKFSRVLSSKKNTLSVYKGAWGEMKKYGAPGKIIYIRSK